MSIDWWRPLRHQTILLQCIIYTSVCMLMQKSYSQLLRLLVMFILGSPSNILLHVLGTAVLKEKESFSLGTINENGWLYLVGMILTNSLNHLTIMSAGLQLLFSLKLDPMVSGLIVLTILNFKRNTESVILGCGLVSTVLIHVLTRYNKRLKFRDAVYRFTAMFTGSTVLCSAILRIDLFGPYLSKSALSLYGYWLVSLIWMFYLSFLIPVKFQPSRFRLYMSRKLYHFAAFAMFTPALFIDRQVTAAAMSAALMMFVGVEQCRLESDHVNDKEAIRFTKYLSQHLTIEEGALRTDTHPITSHITLMAGSFLPIYFSTNLSVGWEEMSGLLSVGIGDAMVPSYHYIIN